MFSLTEGLEGDESGLRSNRLGGGKNGWEEAQTGCDGEEGEM